MQTKQLKLTITGALILTSVILVVLAIMAVTDPVENAGPWLELTGNFHPLLLHLPIGIFVYVFIVEVVALVRNRVGRKQQTAAVTEALGITTITAFVAAFCGLALFSTGDYSGNLIDYHMWLGVAFALLMASLFPIHLWSKDNRELVRPYRYLLFAGIVVMTTTGHYGALITHGNPLKPLLDAENESRLSVRDPGTPLEESLYYEGVIAPILETKCYTCHSIGKKKRSGLLLDSREAMLAGGDRGPALVPGSTEKSLLSRNIHAPMDDDLHMPPEGKPQLAAEEIELIDLWIAAGAPEVLTIAGANLDPRLLLWADNNLTGTSHTSQPGDIPEGEHNFVLPPDISDIIAEVEKLAPNSVHVASADGALFTFTAVNARQSFGDKELSRLRSLLPYLVDMDLSKSQVTSEGLAPLKRASRLKRLDLAETTIDDAALPSIAGLHSLEKLNLYGTRITNKSLSSLEQLKNVESLFLGNTGLSGADLERLKKAMPEKLIVGDILNDDQL
jgi:uncharacterized membrane protein